MSELLEERVLITVEHAHQRIAAIAESCYDHTALNNRFYRTWRTGALPVADVELFARNFYEHVAPTADRLATLFLRLTDERARAETIENLSDELGHGDAGKVHAVLLRNMLEDLLSRLHGRTVTFDDISPTVLPQTRKLVREGLALFGDERPEVGCGALLAQEWHAYPQLVNVYEGMRNYMDHYSLEDFHINSEYFYLHIGATEKEHKIHSVSTAAQMCQTQEQVDLLEHGYTSYLDLLAEYWDGLYEALSVA
ncbi:iron-containing redox enzyme family protein [Nocardia sp. NPDC051570]|uniref:iron-containing redox enzyme family protein n=1 Tax=Nocardia sp. NPDC051570 TaxID=3364324 RepID=UPI0037A92D08